MAQIELIRIEEQSIGIRLPIENSLNMENGDERRMT